MKLKKPLKKLNDFSQLKLLSFELLAVYGECPGTYDNCGGNQTYKLCTGEYTTCNGSTYISCSGKYGKC